MRYIIIFVIVAVTIVVGSVLSVAAILLNSSRVSAILHSSRVSSILHVPRISADQNCDGVCEVNKLGWRVIDPGPTLWFENKNGFAQIAIAKLGRPTDGDEINWAKTQLTGRKGEFGPLSDCKGNMPSDNQKVTLLTCSAPPAGEKPRQGGIFAVQTKAGLQLIGMVMGANVKKSELNFTPLQWLASEDGDSGAMARAVRAAIAICLNGDYYKAADAGASGPEVEAVYHFWNWQNTVNSGRVDKGTDFVLFKNGEVWRSPGAGLRDIDPVKFKEARWNDWGVWRKQAGGFLITLNGLAPTLFPANNFQRYAPATGASQHVEGQWRWRSSYEATNVLVNSEKLLRLHADGRFELNASSGAIGLPDYTVPGMPAMRGTPGATNRNSGHYRIDGYTLELTYNDGHRSSGLFYWAGDGNFSRYAMFLLNGASWLSDNLR